MAAPSSPTPSSPRDSTPEQLGLFYWPSPETLLSFEQIVCIQRSVMTTSIFLKSGAEVRIESGRGELPNSAFDKITKAWKQYLERQQ